MGEVKFGPEAIAAASRLLTDESPQEILRWAVDTFHPRLTMATAFGAEGCCIIHMLAEIEPRVRVFNLDTGYQFPETLELRERIKRALRHRGRVRPARDDGGGVRGGARRPALRPAPRPVLPRPQDRAAAAGGGRLRRLDQRHPPRPDRPTGPRPTSCSGTRSSAW